VRSGKRCDGSTFVSLRSAGTRGIFRHLTEFQRHQPAEAAGEAAKEARFEVMTGAGADPANQAA